MLQAGTPIVDEAQIQQTQNEIEALKAEIENEEIAKLKAENASLKAKEDKRNEEATALLKASNRGTPIAGSSRRNDVQAKSKMQLTARLLASEFEIKKNARNTQASEVYQETIAMATEDYTLNSAAYIHKANSVEVPYTRGVPVEAVSVTQYSKKVTINNAKTVIVPKIVKSNVPLKTVTGEADIKRYDHNIRPTFSTRTINIARTTVSSTVSASDIDDVSIDDRTMVLEIVVEELDSRMVEKKNAEALYGDGAFFEAIIPTLDSAFIEKSKVVNVTDTALASTGGKNPYQALRREALSDVNKNGYFVRPIGFTSFDGTDYSVQTLIKSIQHAHNILKTDSRNNGKVMELKIGQAFAMKLQNTPSFYGDGTNGTTSNIFINIIDQIQKMGITVTVHPEMNETGGAIPVAILVVMQNYHATSELTLATKYVNPHNSAVVMDYRIDSLAELHADGEAESYRVSQTERTFGAIVDSTAAVLFTLSA